MSAPLLRVVYVGRCTLVGGKKGDLWIPEDQVAGKSMGAVQSGASPFSADRATPIVGAIYEATGEVTDGRLTRLGGRRLFKGSLQGDVWDALRAVAKGDAARERDEKAEAKAMRDAKTIAPIAVHSLATIVAQASPYAQEAVIRGLMDEVRRAARELRGRK